MSSSKDKKKKALSKFRGVAVHRYTGRWEAHIWENGKQQYLGSFDEEERAARAYDRAAIKFKQEKAVLNFPLKDYEPDLEKLAKMSKEDLVMELRRDSAGFSRGTAPFRGVSWRSSTKRWEARIGWLLGRKYTYLGTFNTGEEAARAYDLAAVVTRGREAVTNFPLERYEEKILQVEKATPEERKRMEEEIAIRPKAFGASVRRKRFERRMSEGGAVTTLQGGLSGVKREAENTAGPSQRRHSCGGALEMHTVDANGKVFKRSRSAPVNILTFPPRGSAADLQADQVANLGAAGRVYTLGTHAVDLKVGDYFSGYPDNTPKSWGEVMQDMDTGFPAFLHGLLFNESDPLRQEAASLRTATGKAAGGLPEVAQKGFAPDGAQTIFEASVAAAETAEGGGMGAALSQDDIVPDLETLLEHLDAPSPAPGPLAAPALPKGFPDTDAGLLKALTDLGSFGQASEYLQLH